MPLAASKAAFNGTFTYLQREQMYPSLWWIPPILDQLFTVIVRYYRPKEKKKKRSKRKEGRKEERRKEEASGSLQLPG